LSRNYVDELFDAASENRSTYNFTSVPATRDEVASEIDGQLNEWAQGLIVPFVQIGLSNERAVGMTRYMSIRRRDATELPFAIEIGGTWLAASAQRSGINTEAKLLLLGHAFTTWGVQRVDFKSDHRNDRSRTAILRLGATFEGVLRQWQPSRAVGEESLYRDTAMFSITQNEWPAVHTHLTSLIDQTSAD
jgi:RimJ/RimL family protein N-acetyltransferase